MNYDAIFLVYLGSVGSIFLLNAVQWSLSRDWIYGLFTFQTFLWLTNAAVIGLELTDLQRDVIYAVTMGLVRISYIELVDRLFSLAQTYPRLRRWFRSAQLLLLAFILIDLILFLTHTSRQQTPLIQATTISYAGFAVLTCGAGMWVAAQRRDLVGRFFWIGSLFMCLDEGRALLAISGFFWNPSVGPSADTGRWLVNVIGAIFILQLLGFTLCLVFRQRQLAVSQAVEQARLEEQLARERLEAELVQRRLEQEKTDVQLRALQAQVNPHFLFNSLNSLSSLIDDEPERAGQFVNELSLVYRYLLKANDEPLTTVASELEFIQSYYHLLKTRYGNGLDLDIQVKAVHQTDCIPPLTLQLLIENAVKHNVVSPKRPLHVTISTDDTGQLVVRNNLQRKQTRVLSNGVGLSTIALQFQNLRQPAPTVSDTNGVFAVRVPLIKPSVVSQAAAPR